MIQPINPVRRATLVVTMILATASGCATQSIHEPGKPDDNAAKPAASRVAATEDSKMRLTIYLLFAGNCKEAMTFYHDVFGGELALTTVGDSPMKGSFPPAMHAKVVNARLTSTLVDISASDWLRPSVSPVRGSTVCLYLSGGTPGDTRSLFSKLSEGADVTDPLSEQAFGLYGALNDKFGNRWMFQSENR